MTYRFDVDNSTHVLSLITGRKLARRIKHATTIPEKALLAVDLCKSLIEHPTLMQAAAIVGVCRQYVYAASAIADDNEKRRALLAGALSLQDLVRKPANGNGDLASHLAQASDEELIEAARAVGVANVWSRMVEPLLK
jgi:alkylhydroperoxidase family enzyme